MSQLIVIGTFGTRFEADIVHGLLASEGIDALVKADDAGGAYPALGGGGGAQVLVDESDAARAAEILAAKPDV